MTCLFVVDGEQNTLKLSSIDGQPHVRLDNNKALLMLRDVVQLLMHCTKIATILVPYLMILCHPLLSQNQTVSYSMMQVLWIIANRV